MATFGHDVELVFQLAGIFNSDLILVVRDEKNDMILRKFFKFKTSRKVLIGTLNLDETFEQALSKAYTSFYQNIMVVSHFKSGFIQKLIDAQAYIPLLMTKAIWINFIESDQVINDDIRDLNIDFNSKFFLIKKIDSFACEITDVYQIGKNDSKIYSKFGIWKKGKLNAFQGYFYSRRMDLKGHQINVGRPTHLTNTDPRKDIWDLFSLGMNFSLNRDFPTFGTLFLNGSKTGILKLVGDHEVDGTIPSFVYTGQRLDHFDYIFPTEMAQTYIYFQRKGELNWASYIAPFSLGVWLSTIVWMLIAAIIMHLIAFTVKNERRYFGDSVLDVTKALCFQGGKLKIHTTSFYISYLMPYFLAVILIQYYSGGLLSFLTVKNSDVPFKDLESLTKLKTYKISVMHGTFALFYFKTDTGKVAKTIRRNDLLVPDKYLPRDFNAGFQQVCENRWVFLCLSFNVLIKAKCDLMEVNSVFFDQSLGIIVWKGYPYKNVMTMMTRKLQHAGILNLKRKNTIFRYDSSDDTYSSISIDLVFPIFILYLVVIVLSAIILLLERNCAVQRSKIIDEVDRIRSRKRYLALSVHL